MKTDWEALVGLIRAGDLDAEEQFCRVFFPRLVRIAAGRGVPEKDREDLAQETLVSAFKQIQAGEFEGRSSLFTWLTAILHNMTAAYWRRHGRIEQLEGGAAALSLSAPPGEMGFLECIAVREALRRLPAGMAELLSMRYYEQLSNSEIAARLGTKEGTVGERLNKARMFLRRVLCEPAAPARWPSLGQRQKKLKILPPPGNQQ